MGLAKPPNSAGRKTDMDFALNAEAALAGSWLTGRLAFYEEFAFISSAVENLPVIINGLRGMGNDRRSFETTRDVFLMIFKYRLKETDAASLENFRDERWRYESKVKEIVNLWKML